MGGAMKGLNNMKNKAKYNKKRKLQKDQEKICKNPKDNVKKMYNSKKIK